MTISQKLILAFTITISLPLVFIAALMINQSRERAFETFNDATTREVTQIDNAIQLYFKEIEKNVNFLTTNKNITQSQEGITHYFTNEEIVEMRPSLNGGVEAQVFSLYRQFADSHPDIAYIYMGNTEGGYIQWPEANIGPQYDPRARPWYQTGMEANGHTRRTDAYYFEIDDAVIVSTVKAIKKPGDNTEFIGVQGMDVSLKGLTEMVGNIKLGQSGYLMLVDNTGTILVDPQKPANNFELLTKANNGLFQVVANTENGQVYISLNGQDYLASVYTSPKLGWKFIGLLKKSEVFENANRMAMVIVIISLVILSIFVPLAFLFSRLISKPIKEVTRGLEEIAQGGGDLTQRLKIRANDETGQLANSFNNFLSAISSLVGEINDGAVKINDSASKTASVSNKLNESVHQQQSALEMAATAITQMAASSNEVANNCTKAADSANKTQQAADSGQRVVTQAVESVRQLGETVREATAGIDSLHAESENITSILEVIRGIAEQTNLLALNAAIESARAGTHGRGFAVVADEVRALSQRTYESTEEISYQLEKLRGMTQNLSKEMRTSLSKSEQTIDFSHEAKQAFDSITVSVQMISDMNMQIATASQQQHYVAEDINRNISEIKNVSEEVVDIADKTDKNACYLTALAIHLNSLVKQFTV